MGLFGKLFGKTASAPAYEIHKDDQLLVAKADIEWLAGKTPTEIEWMRTWEPLLPLARMKEFAEQGLGPEAIKRIPTFYWSIDDRDYGEANLNSADAKLPAILKGRISLAMRNDLFDMQSIETASSFNSLIREMILSGKLQKLMESSD